MVTFWPTAPELGDPCYSVGFSCQTIWLESSRSFGDPGIQAVPNRKQFNAWLLKEQNICSTRNPFDKLESGLCKSLIGSLMSCPSPSSWHEASTWWEAVKFCHHTAGTQCPIVAGCCWDRSGAPAPPAKSQHPRPLRVRTPRFLNSKEQHEVTLPMCWTWHVISAPPTPTNN